MSIVDSMSEAYQEKKIEDLEAEIKRLREELVTTQRWNEYRHTEIKRLQGVIKEYEQDRLNGLGGIGSPA